MNELADRPVRVPEESILVHGWRLFRWFSNLRLVPRLRERVSKPAPRLIRLFFYDGLTRLGKILLFCCFLIFLFSYRTNSEFLIITAALGFALLVWSATLAWLFRPQVSINRESPAIATVGSSFSSAIQITNTGKRHLYNLAVRELLIPDGIWPKEWERPHCELLGRGQSRTIGVSFQPRRRGVMTLSGVAVQSYFPFFLTRSTQRLEAESRVYVLPEPLKVSLPSLRQVADQASERLIQGMANTRQGPSLEYSYSRPYQTGDSLRRLDHRASSRYGEPMSKVFEGSDEVRRDKVYLMIDLTLECFLQWQRRPADDRALNERLALAVEVGLSAQNEGFSLASLATGKTWHAVDDLEAFYKLIATAKPERASTQINTALPDDITDPLGLHILVTGRWSAEAQSKVERWQNAGILVLVFLIAESATKIDTLPVGKQFIEVQVQDSGA